MMPDLMGITRDELKARKRDYFVASVEDGGLAMEPFCCCGKPLDEQYACDDCNHKCDITFVACADAGALAMMEKLVRSRPDFGKFEFAALES
jgi:hypothetical protein